MFTHEHRSFSKKVLTPYLWFIIEIGAAPRRIVEGFFIFFSSSHDRIRSPQFSLLTNFFNVIYWSEFTTINIVIYLGCFILYCLYDPVPDVKLFKHTFKYDCRTTPSLSSSMIDEILRRTGQVTIGTTSGSFFHLDPKRILSVGHVFDPIPAMFTLTSTFLKKACTVRLSNITTMSSASSPESNIEDPGFRIEISIY